MKYLITAILLFNILLASSIANAVECTESQATVSITSSTSRTDETPFPESERDGFRIYYGEVEGEYPNNLYVPYAGPITVTCLERSIAPLFIVATAVDKQGRESVFTDPEILDALPPVPPVTVADPNPPIFITKAAHIQGPGPGHIVLFNAADFHLNTPNGVYEWIVAGTIMIASPNIDGSYHTDYIQNSPRMDYLVDLNQTGTHYVWVSGKSIDPANTGRNNSLHVGLNGKAVLTSENINFAEPLDFNWTNLNMTDEVVSFEIASPGLHTISVWMREDGFVMDQIMITTDASLIP